MAALAPCVPAHGSSHPVRARTWQVDIKALKNDVWELLRDTKSAAPPKGKAKEEAVAADVSFQGIVGRLPERVPESKLPDCSFAYCFICLLHLANEKGLEIEGVETMDDLRVTGNAAGALKPVN